MNQLVTDTVYLEGTKLVPGGQYTFNYDFTIPTGDFIGVSAQRKEKRVLPILKLRANFASFFALFFTPLDRVGTATECLPEHEQASLRRHSSHPPVKS